MTILEKAGDPRGSDHGYTNRSFNITLDEVGRYVLGDDTIWKEDGIWLIGRAIHDTKKEAVEYVNYPDTAKLVSIPRPILRQNMVSKTIEQGSQILFHSHVTHLDPEQGVVRYMTGHGEKREIGADLVVIADGLHSLGDGLRARLYGEELGVTVEERSYLAAVLQPGDYHDLNQHYIHFWQESVSESFTLGLPTLHGQMGLLLSSTFHDLDDRNTHPFPNVEAARNRLSREFPELFDAIPCVAKLLPRYVRAHFSSKLVTSYQIGDRAVLVGDAACVFPPWAGIGANSAMYAAASLVYQLVTTGTVGEALSIYETQQRFLSPTMVSLAQGLGELFNSRVTEKPQASNDSGLALLIRDARRQAGQLV